MAEPERGFTLVEIVIALLVLSVGLLGLAATAALTTRMVAQGQRHSNTAALANGRLETLHATSCGSMAGGSERVGRVRLTWQVMASHGGRARDVILAVSSPTGAGRRTDRFETVIACR